MAETDTQVNEPLLSESKDDDDQAVVSIASLEQKYEEPIDQNYNLDTKLRTEKELEDFLNYSMITLTDFDVLNMYISTPISKLYNIVFIVTNMTQMVLNVYNDKNDAWTKPTYLERGSQIIVSIEFIGLLIILSTALIMYFKENYVTFIDSLQLSGSFSTFQLFYQCRPRAINQYISTVIKNNKTNIIKRNIENCQKWKQKIIDDETVEIDENDEKREEIINELDGYLDEFERQQSDENVSDFMKESAYGLIVLFIFIGLGIGLLSFILKLSQLNFITNNDIIDWTLSDWFSCIGFSNQLWNMVNINQIKSFAIYDLLYTNKQNIHNFTKNKMQKMLYLDSIIKTKLKETFKWKGILIAISLKYKHILQFLIKNQYENINRLQLMNNNEYNHDEQKQDQKLSLSQKTEKKAHSFLSVLKGAHKIQIDAIAESQLFLKNQQQITNQRDFDNINDYFPNFSFLFERIENRLIQIFGIIAILSIIASMFISLISIILFYNELEIDEICDHEIFAICIAITLILIISLLILIYLNEKNKKLHHGKANNCYLKLLKINIAMVAAIIISTFSIFITENCMQHTVDSMYYRIEYIAILINLCLLLIFISPILIHLLFNPAKIIAFISSVILLCTFLSDAIFSFSMIIFLSTNFENYQIKNYYDHFILRIGAILSYYILNGIYFLFQCASTDKYFTGIINFQWPESHKNAKIATFCTYIVLFSLFFWENKSDENGNDLSYIILLFSGFINLVLWFLTIIPSYIIFEHSVDFIMYHYWIIIIMLLIYLLSDILIYLLSIFIIINYFHLENYYLDPYINMNYMRLIILIVIIFSLHLLITCIKYKYHENKICKTLESICSISLDLIYIFAFIFIIYNDMETLKQFKSIELSAVVILTFIILFGQMLALFLKCLKINNKNIKKIDIINHVFGTINILKLFKLWPN